MINNSYSSYYDILQQELVLALGCTEPIAVAYAAAKAAFLLQKTPEKMRVFCSGNIIKNVMGVTIPNCGDLKGVEAAALIGAFAGKPEKGLEVLGEVQPEELHKVRQHIKTGLCQVELLETPHSLHIIVQAQAGTDTSLVEIAGQHTNIVRMKKNNVVKLELPLPDVSSNQQDAKNNLTIHSILEFAQQADLERIIPILSKQVQHNQQIATEGLTHQYGAGVGATLAEEYGKSDVRVRARMRAAAASDARMGGCPLPVVINSGSGNQGLTASIPVIEYAKELGKTSEEMYRGLIISNLVSIHIKHKVGRLSAFCGAVSAACGSGAAISWLAGAEYATICDTIENTLANVSGIICDGAKPSCAAKIASAVDAAILGHQMAMRNRHFEKGEGILKPDIEQTILSVGRLAQQGMRETDQEILRIMIE